MGVFSPKFCILDKHFQTQKSPTAFPYPQIWDPFPATTPLDRIADGSADVIFVLGVVYTGHVGGLLAFFLGASLVTVVEIIDVIVHAVCRRRADDSTVKPRRNRKSLPKTTTGTGTGNASNHVTFRPVASEALDDDDDVMNYTAANHRNFNTSNMTSSGRLNTLPKVKVNSTTFRAGGGGIRQAETDIWSKLGGALGL